MLESKQLLAHLFGHQTEEDPAVIKAKIDFEQTLTAENRKLITHQKTIFDELTQEFSCEKGKLESKKERAEKGCLSSNNLTYGEIEFQSIAECFHFIRNKYGAFSEPGGVFIDLGHGTGKGILSACLFHEFDKCKGIEILKNLHD